MTKTIHRKDRFGFYAKVYYNPRDRSGSLEMFDEAYRPIGSPKSIKPGLIPVLIYQLVSSGYDVRRLCSGELIAIGDSARASISLVEIIPREKNDI